MTEVEIFRQSLEVSRVVMVITIIMTLISVTFSALTLAFQRSHDRKTVKPLCSLTIRRSGKFFSIIVKNAGLGPMIVTDIRFAEEGNGGVEGGDDASVERQEKFKKMILSVNEERSVFETWDSAAAVAPGAKITVYFRDIYDKKYSVSENLEAH